LDGVNAADQMGEGHPGAHGANFHPSFHHGGPGGGSGMHMSPQEAEAFFSMFFDASDPFGGMGGIRGNRADPFNSMFNSGFGGSMPRRQDGFGGGGIPHGMGSGGFSSMSQPTKRYDAIPVDTVVSLKGLVNASHLNGDRGIIRQYNPSTGRYVVELEDSDETLSVKPSNLLQHVPMKVYGIESKPGMNGKTGTIVAWNPSTERYNVYLIALKAVVSLKPANVILDNGTVGQISGLISKPQLNGKWGTVKEWIRESNKYDLQLSASQIIRIKVENLRVA
jgi:hypothetical protein